MRTTNSVINVLVTMFGQLIRVILNFLMRIVFVKTLSTEYLGLDGLFSNIVVVLSLAELGVGQAITYALYKPIREENIEKIKSIMDLYKKVYRIIGIMIIIVGLLLNFILLDLIKDEPNVHENINVIYSFYVVTIASSYFASYKRELINANQKSYISNIYIFACLIVMNILQIIFLICTKNYYVFIFIKLIITWVENIILSQKANKMFPYLKDKDIQPIDKEEINEIKKNTFGAVFYKLGKVGVNSADNIIISKFIGLTTVGLYSNYRLIVNSVTGILTQIVSSLTASVGNLGTDDKEKVYSIFKKIFFANYWVFSFVFIGILFLINDFIVVWLGEKYVLDDKIVLLISVNFFISGIVNIVSVFRDAFGLYWIGKIKPVVEVIVNLIFSIILVKKYELFGVLLGTLISNITVNLWVEIFIIYKKVFNKNIIEYIKMLVKYLLVMSMVFLNIYLVTINIKLNCAILNLGIKSIIVVFMMNIIYAISFRNTEEYRYYNNLLKKISGKKLKKV